MIKLIRFATRSPELAPRVFETGWWRQAELAAEAPQDVRPARVTVANALPGLSGPSLRPGSGARHDAVSFLWFPDAAALARFRSWLAAAGGGVGGPGVTVVVADEQVPRGADWLERHFREGGGAFKHLGLAHRAPGLTPAEFSRRWSAHAGQVRVEGSAASTVIPECVRGEAYVQNHPVPLEGPPDAGGNNIVPRASAPLSLDEAPDGAATDGDAWAYDAVNEVYFVDLAGLRERVRWFQENPPDTSGADLFGLSEFLAVREEVLFAGTPASAG